MKKSIQVGTPLNAGQMKSLKGGQPVGTGVPQFVLIQCSNGAVVCVSCETDAECAAAAEAACAAAGGTDA